MKSASRVGRSFSDADSIHRWAPLVALVALNTLSARAQQASVDSLSVPTDEHYIALDDFVITDSGSLKTTLHCPGSNTVVSGT